MAGCRVAPGPASLSPKPVFLPAVLSCPRRPKPSLAALRGSRARRTTSLYEGRSGGSGGGSDSALGFRGTAPSAPVTCLAVSTESPGSLGRGWGRASPTLQAAVGLPLFMWRLGPGTRLETHVLDTQGGPAWLPGSPALCADVKAHAFFEGRRLLGPGPASAQKLTFFPLQRNTYFFLKEKGNCALGRKRVGQGQQLTEEKLFNRMAGGAAWVLGPPAAGGRGGARGTPREPAPAPSVLAVPSMGGRGCAGRWGPPGPAGLRGCTLPEWGGHLSCFMSCL